MILVRQSWARLLLWGAKSLQREVRGALEMNLYSLFPNEKVFEDRIQDVFHVDPPEQPTQRETRRPQFLSGELLPLANHIHAASQHNCCILQQSSLPLPADQPSLAQTK